MTGFTGDLKVLGEFKALSYLDARGALRSTFANIGVLPELDTLAGSDNVCGWATESENTPRLRRLHVTHFRKESITSLESLRDSNSIEELEILSVVDGEDALVSSLRQVVAKAQLKSLSVNLRGVPDLADLQRDAVTLETLYVDYGIQADKLPLHERALDVASLAGIFGCPKLTCLKLRFVEDDAFSHLESIKAPIESLELCSTTPDSVAMWRVISRLDGLVELDVTQFGWRQTREHAKAFERLSKLKKLTLSEASDEFLTALSSLLPTIEELRVKLDVESTLEVFRQFKELRSLHVSGGNLRPNDLDSLSRKLCRLSLDMRDGDATDVLVIASRIKSLEELFVYSPALSASSDSPPVQESSLRSVVVWIDEASLGSVCKQLAQCVSIRELGIGTRSKKVLIADLYDICTAPALTHLELPVPTDLDAPDNMKLASQFASKLGSISTLVIADTLEVEYNARSALLVEKFARAWKEHPTLREVVLSIAGAAEAPPVEELRKLLPSVSVRMDRSR